MYTQKYQNVRSLGRTDGNWLLPFVFGVLIGIVGFGPGTYGAKRAYSIDVNQDGTKDVVITNNEGDLTIFQSEEDNLRKLESPSKDLLNKVGEEIKRLERGK
ncbi:hypothetical protein HZA97_05960 [Candidatus Woesearchaeota archaeon]|nr:hypothetical protein [Candidatus Woesearchaeota archaeon]